MPTENERKYVLDFDRRGDLEKALRDEGSVHSTIHQGYLYRKKRSSLRIREKCADGGACAYSMTYKKNVGSRVIEVETSIEERDFKDLWQTCKDRLTKSRYVLDGWEFDFFLKCGKKPYFVLVEHEMPEGQVGPEQLHPLVRDNLILEVPIGDLRFSSRKLSDVGYAKDLYKSVLKDLQNARSRQRQSG